MQCTSMKMEVNRGWGLQLKCERRKRIIVHNYQLILGCKNVLCENYKDGFGSFLYRLQLTNCDMKRNSSNIIIFQIVFSQVSILKCWHNKKIYRAIITLSRSKVNFTLIRGWKVQKPLLFTLFVPSSVTPSCPKERIIWY